jgi:triacylglycerol esterase/lipase EstA (alpha/beta hydrolase family)
LKPNEIHAGYIVRAHYRPAQYPIVLCHGLFGYDTIGIGNTLQMHYWTGIADALTALGCRVYIARVGAVSSVRTRAQELVSFLDRTVGPGQPVNLVAHSMGGLDARYAISHLPSKHLDIRSLTTIGTPHRGSAFMDYCRDLFGVGHLQDYVLRHQEDVVSEVVRSSSPSAIRARLQSHGVVDAPPPKARRAGLAPAALLKPLFAPLDAPAFSNLTREYCATFNMVTPDCPNVHYASYAAVTDTPRASLAFPHGILLREEGCRNDGFVSLQSARWAHYEGTVDADHWDLIPPKFKPGSGVGANVSGASRHRFDATDFYLRIVTRLHDKGY